MLNAEKPAVLISLVEQFYIMISCFFIIVLENYCADSNVIDVRNKSLFVVNFHI